MWSSTLASWHFAFQHHAHCSSTQCTVRPIGSTVTALATSSSSLIVPLSAESVSNLHRWRSSLPGRCCSCLEQFATTRHFCAFSSRLCISAENSVSFPEQFWMYSACEVTSSLLDTLIVHLTYLLTYIPPSCGVRPSDDASVCHVHVTCIASKRLNIFSNLWPSGKYTTPVFPC